MFRMLEQDYAGKVKGMENWFLQFNTTAINPGTSKLERIIRFGNPQLMPLLNNKIKVNCSIRFYCILHSFAQMLIIIVHDVQTETFVPSLHMLMTCKTK